MYNLSSKVYQIARNISACHVNHDDNVVYLHDVPDFELQELASAIMTSCSDLANEATGYDNPRYAETMLPAMLAYLADSTNKDKEIAFTESWRDGVTSYFNDIMEEILNQEIPDNDGYEGHWFEGAYA